jgi:predicted MPP superfamily phosphohydrolase
MGWLATLAVAPLGVMLYAWFEAGWLRIRVLEVEVPGLPPELDGVRIGHLSDFHFGALLSRGNGAGERAARWVSARRPDLTVVTGDLVSHPRGESRLRRVLADLERPLVVLGNHDVAVTRDPFSRQAELDDLSESILLRDEATTIDVRGIPVQVVGVDPTTYADRTAPWALADTSVALRILLCHFPGIARRLPAGVFQLILAGHLHAGQLCVPLPGRRITLAHPRGPYVSGLYQTPGGIMHVSPGSGTTFVPFRLFARPEVTELVLHSTGTNGHDVH